MHVLQPRWTGFVIAVKQSLRRIYRLVLVTGGGGNFRNQSDRPAEELRTDIGVDDGEREWKSESKESKEETSGESQTVRLAIINHIRCWRQPRILATTQTLHLSSISCLSSANSLVTRITHTALGRSSLCSRPETRHKRPLGFNLVLIRSNGFVLTHIP